MADLPETGVKLVIENEQGFLSGLNKASGAVDKFGNSAQGASVGAIAMGTAIGSLVAGGIRQVAGLVGKAAAATGQFLQGSVTMAADLEAQMSGVAAVLGVGNDDLQLLNDLVIDLGINPNLKVSSLEAAAAIEVLAKNGLSMGEIMEGAAEQSIFLANATGADLATASDIVTDSMAIFGFEASQMGTAVDGISAVVQSSKFDINDYALALANGGSVASSVGVSFEDFNTAIAAVSPSFSSGMTAGTAMKNLLLRLVPSTKKAEDEMKALGLITADGANVFFDAEGNMKSMAEITGELGNALNGLSEQQKTATLRTIFGNDAMSAAISLAEFGQDEFVALSDSMATVDAGSAAATRVDNFAGALDIAGGAIEAMKLQIGTAFLPVLTTFAQKFSAFAEENGPKFVQAFEKVAGGITAFFTALDEGKTPLQALKTALLEAGVPESTIFKMEKFAASVEEVIIKVGEFVEEHSEELKGALIGIGVVLAGATIAAGISAIGTALGLIISPIGILIAGVALLGAVWNSNFMDIQQTTEMFAVVAIARLDGVSKSATAMATVAIPLIKKNLGILFEAIINDIALLITAFNTKLKPVLGSIGALWKLVWEAMKGDIDAVLETLNTFIEGAKTLSGIITGIGLIPSLISPQSGTRSQVDKGIGGGFGDKSIPASGAQQAAANNSTTTNNAGNVTLNNNFANQPTVTDRDILVDVMTGVR